MPKRLFILLLVIGLFSCHPQDPVIGTQSAYFDAIEKHDIQLSPPMSGEWLDAHKEKGQTFEQYKQFCKVHSTPGNNVIYLQPVGDFTPIQREAMITTQLYVEIFFQLKTVLLEPVSDSLVTARASRVHDDHTQLLASYVLDSVLKDKRPADGIALMAFSEKDLYPKDDWNYVFGLASYTKRVGVSSIYRLQDGHLDSTNYTTCLRRLINISSHEIGHMLSLAHCIHAKCVMNGTNGMSETDRAPLRLCTECQKKLFWNFRYDNTQRLKALALFCTNNRLENDRLIFQRDLDALR